MDTTGGDRDATTGVIAVIINRCVLHGTVSAAASVDPEGHFAEVGGRSCRRASDTATRGRCRPRWGGNRQRAGKSRPASGHLHSYPGASIGRHEPEEHPLYQVLAQQLPQVPVRQFVLSLPSRSVTAWPTSVSSSLPYWRCSCAAASVQGQLATGERAGQRVRRLLSDAAERPPARDAS